MCVTICGRFRPDEGAVAGYGNRIRVKSPAKWGVQIAGMIFQTRSSAGHLENIARNVYRERVTLLFTGNVPRGVFCEQSSQKTRELRREIMRMHDFCASRSALL